jgi:quinol monooxygenase YgiN
MEFCHLLFRLPLLLYIFFSSFGFCTAATAKVFVIGVEAVNYYPFYNFSNESNNKPSFTRELLETFFKAQGHQIRFLALPVKRFDKWYIENSIDFKFPDNVRWRESSQYLNLSYSVPVVNLTAGTYVVKAKANIARDNVERLATIFGFFPTLWYDKISDKSITLVEESSPLSVVKHVLYGNVEATNIDKNVINYNLLILNKEPDEIVLNENIKNEHYAYHFSSIRYPQIIKQFNEYLVRNHQLLADLKQKYGIIEPQLNQPANP